jgi:hypothetical protein
VTPSTRRGSSLRIAVLMGRGLSGNGERNRGPPTHMVALQGPATTLIKELGLETQTGEASNTALLPSTRPSRVAAIHRSVGRRALS